LALHFAYDLLQRWKCGFKYFGLTFYKGGNVDLNILA